MNHALQRSVLAAGMSFHLHEQRGDQDCRRHQRDGGERYGQTISCGPVHTAKSSAFNAPPAPSTACFSRCVLRMYQDVARDWKQEKRNFAYLKSSRSPPPLHPQCQMAFFWRNQR